MNTTINGTASSRAQHRLVLKSSVAVLAAAGLLSAFPVLAQEVPAPAPAPAAETPVADPNVSVVTVTGMRRAVESAQKIKQDADNVMDSIVADDIGKFPDTNVAQTLARVTGIQVRRDAGEANSVLIRGLPFIATLLNGREMFTTAGRYIQLAEIPSAMLQRVDVYKSQSADLIEGGIAGVIDVRTNRPFDFKEFTASAQVGGRNKDKADATDPELSGMISNRWKTGAGELGALFGVSSVKDRFTEERVFQTFPINKSFAAPNLTGPDLVGLQNIYGQRKREAANYALQWKPSQDLEIYAEGLYATHKKTDQTDFFVGLPWATTADQIKVTKIPGTDQTETINSTNSFTILSTQARQSKTTTSQHAVGARWRAAPGLRLSTELAVTDSKYDWVNPILDTSTSADAAYIKTNAGKSPYAQYTGAGLTDPTKIVLSQFFDRYGYDTGKSTDWRADGTWTPESDGFLKDVSFGVRANDREASSIKSNESSVQSRPGITMASVPGLSCTTPGMSENYGTGGWATPCASYLLNNTASVRQLTTGESAAKEIDPASRFKNTEKNYAAYVKTRVGFDLGQYPVEGVIGVRVSKADTTTQATNVTIVDVVNPDGTIKPVTTYTPTTSKSSGTEVLPSMNFKLAIRSDLLARFAYNKTLNRPEFAQLNPATAYIKPNGTTNVASASGGNPDLKPFSAQNFEGTLEWYFASTGSVSGTVFRHNFDGYIVNRVISENFEGVPYNVTRPANSEKGHLQGVELAYQQFYDGLPGWLSGFGLQANVTYTEGGITSGNTPLLLNKPFQGLSRLSYNIVGLYEKDAWSARLAYNWRSKFVDLYADTPDRANLAGKDLIVAPTSSLDGSLSYKLNKHVTFNLTGTNLLNFKYRDYWDNENDFPRDTRRYDRTVGLSMNLKY
ncbi:TonB-dependent receptor [Duganella sp. FT27W]|uniref:TonB-dependent receptor n=1 Tax=Duganella sp. FT27W TaxID=2654636 RepID=UPI00128E1DE3|nr:TonB-dependent receptor [Duganella sp. FT27W]MPQ57750.1 TonB-dependent receptor [Duganella sp. FT27W]